MEYKTETTFFIKDSHGETVTTLDTSPVGTHIPVLSAVIDSKLSSYDLMTLEMPADVADVEKIEEEQTIIFEDVIGWREYIIKEVEDVDSDSAVRSVFAELSSVELLDEVLDRELGSDVTNSRDPEVILADVLKDTRWEVGHVDSSIYSQAFNDGVQYKTVLEVIDLISSKFSAEVQFSYAVDYDGITRRYVNLYKQFGRNIGKRFEVGKDVTEISRTVDTTDIKTAIIPYTPLKEETDGEEAVEERLTIESVEWLKSNGDPTDKPLGQNYLEDPEAKQAFGRFHNGDYRNRFLSIEMDVETEEELIRMAWVQLGRYTKPKVTYEMKAVDLWALTGDRDLEHERVALGDSVVVIDDNFAKPITVETRVVELKRDLLDPANNELVLGESRTYFKARETEDRVEELSDRLISSRVELVNRIRGAGGNDNYYGSDVPASPDLNDIWFRPHPEKPNETQMLRFNGTMWVMIADTSETTENAEAIAEQQEDIDGAKESADKANQDILEAVQSAGFTSLQSLAGDLKRLSDSAIDRSGEALEGVIDAMSKAGEAEAKAIEALSDANTAMGSAQDALSTANNAVGLAQDASTLAGTLSGQVSDFELTVTGFNQTVNNYEDQVAQFTSDVNGLNSTVASYETQVDEFGNTVGTYATQVSQFENTVYGLNSTVSSYQSDVQGYQAEVSTLTNTVSGFESTVTEVRNEFDNLEIGGRNLLLESHFYNSDHGWHGRNGTLTRENDVLTINGSGSNATATRFELTTVIKEVGVYTLSAMVKATTGLQFRGFVGTHSTNESTQRTNNEWTVIRTQFEITAPNKEVMIRLYLYDGSAGQVASMDWAKLEKGNKATDWSPAPEDMATSVQVSTLSNTVDGLKSEVESYEQTVDGYSAQVSSFENTLSGLNSTVSNYQSDVQGYQSQVSTLTNTVNGFNATVQRVEGDYSDLSGTVQGLGASIGVVEGQITNRVWQTDIQTAVDDIEVGGRNLVVLSKLLTGRYLDNSTGELASAGGHATTDFIGARPLTEYIYSGVNGVQQIRFVSYDINKKFISGVLYSGYRGDSQIYKTPENTEYIRISANFSAGSHYNDWVLEKGNIATDWTPAPEDTLQLISNVETEWKQTAQGFEQSITRVETGLDGKASLTAFNTLTSTVNGTVTRVGNAEGKITTIETNVNGLQTTVAGKASQTQVTQLANGFNVLSTDFNNLEIGGRNLILYSHFYRNARESGDSGWRAMYGQLSYLEDTILRYINDGTHTAARIEYRPRQGILEPDTWYTFSMRFRSDRGFDVRRFENASPEEEPFLQSAGEYTVQSFRFRTNSSGNQAVLRFYQRSPLVAGGATYFDWVKIEKGRVATDWSPAPEDMATQAQFTVLNDQINLRVKEGDVMSQINIEAGRTLIQSKRLLLNATNTVITGTAWMDGAVIANASMDGATIKDATIGSAKIVNLDVGKIVGETANFVRAGFNSISSTTSIDANGLSIQRTDGTRSARLGVNGYEFWIDGAEHGTMGVRHTSPSHSLYPKKSVSLYARKDSFVALSYQGSSTDGSGYSALTMDGETGNVRISTDLRLAGALDMSGSSTSNQFTINFGFDDKVNGMIYPVASEDELIVSGTKGLRLSVDGYRKMHMHASGNTVMYAGIDMNEYNITNIGDTTLQQHSTLTIRSTGFLTRTTSGDLSLVASKSGSGVLSLGVGWSTTWDTLVEINSSSILMYGGMNMNGYSITNSPSISDGRLKTIQSKRTENDLDKLLEIEYQNITWNESGEGDVAFIAQQVRQVMPEIITTMSNGYLGYNQQTYVNMIGHAVQQLSLREESTNKIAIQALESTETNEEKINKLQQELSKANRRIEELESVM